MEGRLLTVKYATQRGQEDYRNRCCGRTAGARGRRRRMPRRRRPPWRASIRRNRRTASRQQGPRGSRPAARCQRGRRRLAAPAPAADEKPLESETPVEATTLWKIATSTEVDAWRAAGALTGSALDERDGFVHCATADQARVVADLYFAGQQDLKLLRVSVESLKQGHDVDAEER